MRIITRAGVTATVGAMAMALAVPGIAAADDAPASGGDAGAGGFAVQVNAPELTATQANGITTVTFAPDSVGGHRHCTGPQVSDATVAQAAGEGGLPDSVVGQIEWGLDNADMFAIPKGFVAANQALIDQYVDAVYREDFGPSREELAQFGAAGMLGPLLGVGEELGQDSGNPFGEAEASSFMERTSDHNAFGYELNPDHTYLAMASCATGDLESPDSFTDQKAYWTYINAPAFDSGAANQVTEFKPGATVMAQVTGLKAGGVYSSEGNSTPFCTLEDVRADADGVLTFVCALPTDLEVGMHHFYVKDGTDTVASIEFTVAADGADQGALSAAADTGDGDDGTGPGDGGGDTTGGGSLGTLFGSLSGS
ncbi:hypothetical protein [Tomitella gaofuii]|uniref:hypothetical protein n=1 Tax=Tomitella gaofuii TaxID=2760083 RepID=UPI0015F7F438|nr:hypothetical protein [Tomitella gaofuii]